MSEIEHNHAAQSVGNTELSPQYILKLYVAGNTNRSMVAIHAVKTFCEAQLRGRYQLEVVDLYLNAEAAQADGVMSAPTLLCKSPAPVRKLIGTIPDEKQLRTWLGLTP